MDKIQRTIEVERIVNLAKGFGWELESSREEDETLQITLKKSVKSAMPVG